MSVIIKAVTWGRKLWIYFFMSKMLQVLFLKACKSSVQIPTWNTLNYNKPLPTTY